MDELGKMLGETLLNAGAAAERAGKTYVPFEAMIGVGSWDSARDWLKRNFVDNETERKRKADALERDEFFENRGDMYMERLVERAYADDDNRRLRKALIPVTKWNNVIFRIVDEKATVYSEPARRRIAADDERYQAFLELISLDEIMGELNRLLVLHEDVWVQYRVRDAGGGRRAPAVDVTSPALFWAIHKPTDPTLHIATLLDQKPSYLDPKETDHHFRLWTPYETIALDGKLCIIDREFWPLGRMPGFVASTRPAAGKQRLLALSPFADVVAAHKGVWMQDILLFKESKSANKQTYVSGDTSQAAMGQQGDTESEVFLPDGVNVQAIDRGMELGQFRDNGDYIMERAGANHGLPPSVMHHRDSSSGAEVHLRRLPLRELRKKQIPVMRRTERELAEVQSLVNAIDFDEYAFDMEGWGVDFGEVQQPLTEQERDAVFEKRRKLRLRSTLEEELARNPDLRNDKAEAMERVKERIDDETKLLAKEHELQRMNGGLGSELGDNTPEQNGAEGRAVAVDDDGLEDDDEAA